MELSFLPTDYSPQKSKIGKFAWFVLFYNVLVILWGAYVRATGSGAGCGSHWPLCNGEIIPHSSNKIETIIEFTHRASSGIAFLLVITLTYLVFKNFNKNHLARSAGIASSLFICTEALIGAGLVLFKLVAGNTSVARAIYLSIHLINTFLLLGSLAITAHSITNPSISIKNQNILKKSFFLIGIIAMLVLGVSGGIAALGDTLFPSKSLASGLVQDFSATSHFLLRLRLWHPIIAVSVGIYILVLSNFIALINKMAKVQLYAKITMFLIIIQFVTGIVNLALLAPIWLQIIHLLFADLIWIFFLSLIAATFSDEIQTIQKQLTDIDFCENIVTT